MINSWNFAKFAVICLMLAGVVIGSTFVLDAPIAYAGVRERTTGSSWGWVFNDPWYEPHYGASFRGSYGADPNYTGPGGNTATNCCGGGIKVWDWWGNEKGTLLTPKSWCYPTLGCEAARQNPSKYNATVVR